MEGYNAVKMACLFGRRLAKLDEDRLVNVVANKLRMDERIGCWECCGQCLN